MPDPQKTNRQAMPIATLQRIQAEKRGEVPVTPPPPGVPRRIPQYQHPSESDVRRMRDQVALLERQIIKSPYERWRLEDDRVVSKGNVLSAIQKNKDLIRNYFAQKQLVEKNLDALSKLSYEGVHYKAYIDDRGRTVIKPPPGIPELENLRNIIKHSPPWVTFKTADGRDISRAEAYNLIIRPEEKIIARIEGIKQQIRTGDPAALWNYLTYSLGLLPADPGGVIADWAFTVGGLKTAEEHLRSQVELETKTLEELKTVEGRLGLILKTGMLFVAPYAISKVAALGTGYLTGLAPGLAPAAKYGAQIIGAYVTGAEAAEISTLMQAGKHEAAASRGIELGISAAIGIKAYGSAYRTGLIAGYRKRMLTRAITSTEKTRINTLFDTFKAVDKMPAGKKTVIRITDIENLSADDIIKVTKFLKSPEAKKFHIILGGSAANPIPGRISHDLDFAIGKYRIPRPKFKGLGFERWETSRVKSFKAALKKFGFSDADIKKFDISDAEKVGEIFAHRGKIEFAAARIRKPVRVPGERYLRVSIKEQLQRKLASMLSPMHKNRGKDWDDLLLLFKQKIDSDLASKLITPKKAKSLNTLLTKVTKWKPTIKDGALIAPAKTPTGLEIKQFTTFERFLRPRVPSPTFVTKTEKMQIFVPQMVPTTKKVPVLIKILIFLVGEKNTVKILDFLKMPEGEKLYASFGAIPGKKYDPYKTPLYIPPVTRKPTVKPTTTPYVTMLAPSITPPYTPTITTPVKPPIAPPVKPPVKPTITPPYMPSITPPTKPPVKPISRVYEDITPRKKPKRKIEYGYHTWAKKHATKPKRAWVKLSDKPLKEKQALGLGAKAVDQSVARTFKIKKTTKPVVSKPHLANVWYQKKHKFRKPIKAGKVQHKSPLWIEKSKHLIDSPEEFKGITVEGWKAKQAKKQQKMFMYIGPPRSKK